MDPKIFFSILLWLTLSLLLPTGAPAAVAGHLTQLEGKVDFLKQGKLPVTSAKLNDAVEPGDVLRTKSLSKAQITFVDGSVLTISPGSRIAIEEYIVDAGKGKRNAVLELFSGIALVTVSKIFQSEKPDFVVKTNTAIMGVRGTEVGVRLHPNSSTFLNFSGHTRVSSLLPEVQGMVELMDNQGTTVERGLPPTLPFGVSAEDREQFMRQLATGLTSTLRGKNADSSESSQANLECSSDFGPVSISPLLTPRAFQPQSNSSASLPFLPTEGSVSPPIQPPPSPSPSSSGPPYGPPSPPLAGPPGQSFQPPGPPLGPPSGGAPYGNAFGRSK
jgi:hypothetical protein